MKIEPVYCTFEQAKLLKDKGFDIWNVDSLYYKDGNITKIGKLYAKLIKIKQVKLMYEFCYPRPEQWVVVEWLRIKHGIWIVINFANKTQWYFDLNRFGFDGKDKSVYKSNYSYDSPQEAYSAAIDHVLNNLI